MNINEVGRCLDEIRDIWAEVRRLKIPYSVISEKTRAVLRLKIETLFDRYDTAVENSVLYLNGIRKEINRIKHDLRQCIKANELYEKRVKLRIYRWYMFHENKQL